MNTTLNSPEQYHIYIAPDNIWKYIAPIQIVVGILSNILSIIVLSRKNMRKSTTMFYFRILAFGDILVLCTGLLRYWIRHVFDTDIRKLSDVGCKFHSFLTYFSLDFSTWILVAVTIDRCITVCLPHLSKIYCTIKRAKIVIMTIFILIASLNCHFFTTTTLAELQEPECDLKLKHKPMFLSVWPWVDLVVYCVGPLIIMIVCTTFIIQHIKISQDRMANYRQSIYGPNSAVEMRVTQDGSRMENILPNRRENRLSHVTTMLLSVNTVYFICTIPITVYLILYRSMVQDAPPTQKSNYELVWTICNILQYMNNTLNFFMYCLTNPKVRKELLCIFHLNKGN